MHFVRESKVARCIVLSFLCTVLVGTHDSCSL
uniref:Uncharacterized protein n=1 Tax=Arundo donax TaxID=35708 RepID=A0A0A8YJT5_ARUDO